jgi:ATP-dependent Lon protease
MAHLTPDLARSIVLRHFPRVLRAGLDGDGRNGAVASDLVRDAAAMDADLGSTAKLWLATQSGARAVTPSTGGPLGVSRVAAVLRHLGLGGTTWVGRAVGPGPDGLAALDAHAAARNDAVVRDIADALLLLGVSGAVHLAAPRLASSAWNSLDRLPEAAATLRGLSLLPPAERDLGDTFDAWSPDLDAVAAALGPGPGQSGEPRSRGRQRALSLAFSSLAVEARILAIGLSALSVGRVLPYFGDDSLAALARAVGQAETAQIERQATERQRELSVTLHAAEPARSATATAAPVPEPRPEPGAYADEPVPVGHVLVCAALEVTGTGKGHEVTRGFRHAIGRPLPLVETRDLAEVRRELLPEFPYAEAALDSVLGAFAGRQFVHCGPLVVEGPPGAGKSRFVRRLGEALGVGVYRIDASNDGGASFGGTERRWYSSEPCKPFAAIARFSQANPLLLVDEIDKAPTRSEHGRIWDSMLQALDPENAARFPDPCLQTDLDVSWVSVVCTANDTGRMPGPLLDRMRIVRFPAPLASHLGVLLPGVMRGIASERGFDPRFLPLPDAVERDALARRWRGGSVRRLQRAVEAVLRVRERLREGVPQ